jgi:hypothetical protein
LTPYNLRLNAKQLPLPSGPLRLNLHYSRDPGNIVTETAPSPLLGTRNQSPPHRVPMDISQLLDPPSLAPHIDVVIPSQPERPALRFAQLAGNILLQHLQGDRKLRPLRLADQQVNVLRHHHIPSNVEAIPQPDTLKGLLEDVTGMRRAQPGRAIIAAECKKMETTRFLKPLETPGHRSNRKPRWGCVGSLRWEFVSTIPKLGTDERKSNSRPVPAKNAGTRTGQPQVKGGRRGLAQPFPSQSSRVPRPCRVFCDRAGILIPVVEHEGRPVFNVSCPLPGCTPRAHPPLRSLPLSLLPAAGTAGSCSARSLKTECRVRRSAR